MHNTASKNRGGRHWLKSMKHTDYMRSKGAASDVRIIDPVTGEVVSTIARKLTTDWSPVRKHEKQQHKHEAKTEKPSVRGNVNILGFDGPPCPRCKTPMQVREYAVITEKLLRKPCYCARWYYCANPKCRTKAVYADEYMVSASVAGGPEPQTDLPGLAPHGEVENFRVEIDPNGTPVTIGRLWVPSR